jgi:hypothetical protein
VRTTPCFDGVIFTKKKKKSMSRIEALKAFPEILGFLGALDLISAHRCSRSINCRVNEAFCRIVETHKIWNQQAYQNQTAGSFLWLALGLSIRSMSGWISRPCKLPSAEELAELDKNGQEATYYISFRDTSIKHFSLIKARPSTKMGELFETYCAEHNLLQSSGSAEMAYNFYVDEWEINKCDCTVNPAISVENFSETMIDLGGTFVRAELSDRSARAESYRELRQWYCAAGAQTVYSREQRSEVKFQIMYNTFKQNMMFPADAPLYLEKKHALEIYRPVESHYRSIYPAIYGIYLMPTTSAQEAATAFHALQAISLGIQHTDLWGVCCDGEAGQSELMFEVYSLLACTLFGKIKPHILEEPSVYGFMPQFYCVVDQLMDDYSDYMGPEAAKNFLLLQNLVAQSITWALQKPELLYDEHPWTHTVPAELLSNVVSAIIGNHSRMPLSGVEVPMRMGSQLRGFIEEIEGEIRAGAPAGDY